MACQENYSTYFEASKVTMLLYVLIYDALKIHVRPKHGGLVQDRSRILAVCADDTMVLVISLLIRFKVDDIEKPAKSLQQGSLQP
jgi:hypothetical protein